MSGAEAGPSVRAEVRSWLDAHWDPERPLVEWRALLADAGWGVPDLAPGMVRPRPRRTSWPPWWPRSVGRRGAVGPPIGSGITLAAPTLLAHGSDTVKARHLRRILTGRGQVVPALLRARERIRPGRADHPGRAATATSGWSAARRSGRPAPRTATFGMLLARTDWDAPKHRGITYFVLPMGQPGVEVRPLRQMNGHASFNEVFLTEARVPVDHVVGEVDAGWAAALTTLAHERGLGANRLVDGAGWAEGRTAREAMEEATEHARTYAWYPQRAGRSDLLVEAATGAGWLGRPTAARRRALTRARVAGWNVERSRAARAGGRSPGPEGSVAKLAGSDIARRSARAHGAMAGAGVLLTGEPSPHRGVIAEILVSVPAVSIAGGTDEIQHNIVGERALGLPREPSNDAQLPFFEVRTNTSARAESARGVSSCLSVSDDPTERRPHERRDDGTR